MEILKTMKAKIENKIREIEEAINTDTGMPDFDRGFNLASRFEIFFLKELLNDLESGQSSQEK